MSSPTSILPLLESVVQDNLTFKFPIESINQELVNMFLEPLEFDYFRMMAYRKLKKSYGEVVGHIFLQVMQLKLNLDNRDIFTLSVSEYQSELEKFISTLENTYITRVEKNTPDGEMLGVMI